MSAPLVGMVSLQQVAFGKPTRAELVDRVVGAFAMNDELRDHAANHRGQLEAVPR